MISACSRPRVHFGTVTGSVRTFSRPSAFIVWADHWMARARFGDPLNRAPNVSVSSASRLQAKSSTVAALINRSASARRGPTNEWVLWAWTDATTAMAQTTAAGENDERMWIYFSSGGPAHSTFDCWLPALGAWQPV